MGKSKEIAELGNAVSVNGSNVGIGVATPVEELHLAASLPTIRLEDTDNSYYSHVYSQNGDLILSSDQGNANAGSAMRFEVDTAERMRIDSAGRVTMPYQPAFLARAASITTYGTGWQKITYDTLLNQRGSNYSITTSRFTAPVSGWYAFFASLNSVSNADTDGAIGFKVNNNTSNSVIDVMQSQNGGAYNGRTVSGCKYLSANDYVEVWRFSTVDTTTRSSPWSGNFSGYLIG